VVVGRWGMPILAIHDEPDVRDMIRTALEVDGLTEIIAEDGDEGLATVERFRPCWCCSLCRCRAWMGWNVLREIRFRGFEVPVIIVSGAPDIALRAQAAGAVAHLSKPSSSPN